MEEALKLLKYLPKKAARILEKAVASAVANAENNFGQDRTKLKITRILITKGTTYKRSRSISRGRSHPILKLTSHILVEVGV